MRRKLVEGRAAAEPGGITALRALRLSMARTAGDSLGLALGAIAARTAARVPDEVAQDIPADGLLIRLDCASGQVGAAVLSLSLVSALIQQQTMGRVSERGPEPRAFTDTDALICAGFVEEVLAMAAGLAEDPCDRALLGGIRFGVRAPDVRTLCLALRAEQYRSFRFTLDIAEGRRQGDFALLLPDDRREDARQGDHRTVPPDLTDSPLMQVPVELEAVLARLRLPLDRLNAFQVGDLVAIPRDRLDETGLVAVDGTVVARGRLGQMNGQRAVRLMVRTGVPRATNDAPTTGFEPLQRKSAPPDRDRPVERADIADLAAMSPEAAAREIGALAGLSDEDLKFLAGDAAPDIEGRPV